jgi:hypothetical protein
MPGRAQREETFRMGWKPPSLDDDRLVAKPHDAKREQRFSAEGRTPKWSGREIKDDRRGGSKLACTSADRGVRKSRKKWATLGGDHLEIVQDGLSLFSQ